MQFLDFLKDLDLYSELEGTELNEKNKTYMNKANITFSDLEKYLPYKFFLEVNKKVKSIKRDIPFIVEIFVTHKVDEEKNTYLIIILLTICIHPVNSKINKNSLINKFAFSISNFL